MKVSGILQSFSSFENLFCEKVYYDDLPTYLSLDKSLLVKFVSDYSIMDLSYSYIFVIKDVVFKDKTLFFVNQYCYPFYFSKNRDFLFDSNGIYINLSDFYMFIESHYFFYYNNKVLKLVLFPKNDIVSFHKVEFIKHFYGIFYDYISDRKMKRYVGEFQRSRY